MSDENKLHEKEKEEIVDFLIKSLINIKRKEKKGEKQRKERNLRFIDARG